MTYSPQLQRSGCALRAVTADLNMRRRQQRPAAGELPASVPRVMLHGFIDRGEQDNYSAFSGISRVPGPRPAPHRQGPAHSSPNVLECNLY